MAKSQLEVLSALDNAKTQLYHFTAIVIAGMGFFTDAYDLFCISVVTKLLGRIYYTAPNSKTPGILPVKISAAVTGVALVMGFFTSMPMISSAVGVGHKVTGPQKVYAIPCFS
ncbi:hypothetical protein RHSIM_Rhsim04G0183400 [Rhododendron simsii]|uniref:Uncharacterized protein n=1 Tax=Rhododendron simsii TaxID=118357 RepID=A0A834LQZ0_RHOSS|nr:hypothetical protein RHSIM_Rhsim04G0183400 [Rhododendron simsii]